MKTIIHVNQHLIRQSRKDGISRPALTVKNYKANRRAYGVEIAGPSKVVYRPEKPLSCGARAWVETTSAVKILRKPTQ